MDIIEGVSEKLICESCGEEFSCGANVGKCWCFSVELKAETATELREDFNSCLCENCLSKYQKSVKNKNLEKVT
jgi:hypothetical protein